MVIADEFCLESVKQGQVFAGEWDCNKSVFIVVLLTLMIYRLGVNLPSDNLQSGPLSSTDYTVL